MYTNRRHILDSWGYFLLDYCLCCCFVMDLFTFELNVIHDGERLEQNKNKISYGN